MCACLCGCVCVCVQCCGQEKWGDWKPHLAVMLANETADPGVQQRAVVAMGDTLGNVGQR